MSIGIVREHAHTVDFFTDSDKSFELRIAICRRIRAADALREREQLIDTFRALKESYSQEIADLREENAKQWFLTEPQVSSTV